MPRKLQDSVVVITGASSGIGRATALALARRGATLALAARRAQLLHELAQECERLGGRALVVPTDVTDAQAVHALARQVVATFGRIDTWVNNAAVYLLGRFEETPIEDYRRVIETNLFGYISGARAALPIFREQGSGILINVASVISSISQPYSSAYAISKHGIRALGMSLRQELVLDRIKDIHVCTVMPAAVDTPIYQHAANYTGRAVQAVPPIYPAEQVAAAIVRLTEHPQREVFVGNAGRMFALISALAPGAAERIMARQVDKRQLVADRPAAPTAGNLFEPMAVGSGVSGGWQQAGGRTARRFALGTVALLPLALVWRWIWQQRHTRHERVAEVVKQVIG